MKLSIATVWLSGGLDEKLEAIAAAGFKGVEIFENDLLSFDGTPAEVRRMAARSRPRDHHLPAVPRLRGHAAGASASRGLRPRRAQVRPDGRARLRSAAGLLQRLAARASAASTAPPPISTSSASAPRSAACASASRRWPGAATSTTTATPGRWCAAPTTRRSASCSTASTSSRARPTSSRSARSRATASSWCRSPTRRCSTWTSCPWSRHFRNFPGQGDLPVIDFMTALQATGYDGLLSLEIFNDQFRAGSARSVAVDGHRSLIYLLDQLRARGGTGSRRLGQLPPRSPMPRHRVHRVRRSTRTQRAGIRGAAARPRLRARRRAQVEGGDALDARRDQPRRQHREGRLRPFLQHHPRHRASARSASRSTTPRRRSTARRGAARPAVPPGGRAGRARDPRGARPRRQPGLFHRPGERPRPRLGHRVRADRRDATGRTPACAPSTTSRSRCTTRRC